MKTHHTHYTKFPEGDTPIVRSFRLARHDWAELNRIREELLEEYGIKLSVNAALAHLIHRHQAARVARELKNVAVS